MEAVPITEAAHRYAAKQGLARALRAGVLRRPTACSACGRNCKPDAHHHNGYLEANALDVIWLCRSCHQFSHPRKPGRKLDSITVKAILRTRGMVKDIAAKLGTSMAYVSMVVHQKKNATADFMEVAQLLLYQNAREGDLASLLARYPRRARPGASRRERAGESRQEA